jgi:hypothetical protein
VTTQDALRQRALSVPSKADRVFMFHRETLHALKELVQAAGLEHPQQISAAHIVRRNAEHQVRLLSNLLPFVKPGEVLAAERGEADWPHQTFRLYWPQASAASFAVQAVDPVAARQPTIRSPQATTSAA